MGIAGCKQCHSQDGACGLGRNLTEEIPAEGKHDSVWFDPSVPPSSPSDRREGKGRVTFAEDSPPGTDDPTLAVDVPASDAVADAGVAEEQGETTAEAQAQALLRQLRASEAALRLQDDGEASGTFALRRELDAQLGALGSALRRMEAHKGLKADGAMPVSLEDAGLPNTIPGMPGIPVPTVPSSSQSINAQGCCSGKRDVLDFNFDLDKNVHVDIHLEFFPDGSCAIEWSATDIPIPLQYAVCLVHEVDLIGEIAPFILSSGVVHQFNSNEADRVIRVVAKPPIPFVSGLEAVAQRYGFDLLDSPWEAMCLVESSPQWKPVSPPKTGPDEWRGVQQPPPYKAGMRQIDVKTVVALARPVGPQGKLTTILFSGEGDIKVPRSLLPDWLVTWLCKTIAQFIYQRALDRVAKFDTSEHGRRLKGSSLYAGLRSRIAEFVAAKGKQDNSTGKGSL